MAENKNLFDIVAECIMDIATKQRFENGVRYCGIKPDEVPCVYADERIKYVKNQEQYPLCIKTPSTFN